MTVQTFSRSLATVIAGVAAFVPIGAAHASLVDTTGLTLINSQTGSISQEGTVSGIDNPDDATVSVTFTPNADDLTGTVVLFEIGAESNGTSLLLVDGVPVFLSKAGGNTPFIPEDWGPDTSDLSFDSIPGGGIDRTIAVNLLPSTAPLVAGQEASIAFVYDSPGSGGTSASSGLSFVVDTDTSGTSDALITGDVALTDVNATAWTGNRSLGWGQAQSNIGGANNVGGNAFNNGDADAFGGAFAEGSLWVGQGTLVPEPGSLGLIGLGGLLMLVRKQSGRA